MPNGHSGKNGNGKRKPRKYGWFAGKSGRKTGTAVVPGGFKPGDDPRRGHGPKPGTGGRPRDEFYDWLRSIVYDPRVRARYEAIMLLSPDPDLFLKALKFGDERLHGKPTQPVDFGGNGDEDVEIEFRLRRPAR